MMGWRLNRYPAMYDGRKLTPVSIAIHLTSTSVSTNPLPGSPFLASDEGTVTLSPLYLRGG